MYVDVCQVCNLLCRSCMHFFQYSATSSLMYDNEIYFIIFFMLKYISIYSVRSFTSLKIYARARK